MKTSHILPTLILSFFLVNVIAQQGINYKAIIHDINSDALANTPITVQFTILENGTTNVYQETHNPTTDANGIIVVYIGEGSLIGGDFSAIEWGSNPHFLKTEIDTGEGFTDMGTTEFSVVPYSFHAKDAATRAYVDQLEIRIAQLEAMIPDIVDNDQDGWPESVDCDDYDDTVYPGAPELCDGLDNDCNDIIDDKDWDNDGYIDDQCTQYSHGEATDCNDSDPNINPGEQEICGNGADEDCSGMLDDKDLDGDGAIDADFLCGGTDCDDLDPTVYQGAEELPDAKDNDCDGDVDEGLIPQGAVIVTEIMYDPSAVPDLSGEWIEVTNVLTNSVNLHGFRISDLGSDTHIINSPSGIVLAPGESAVIGSNSDPLTNGGVICDYQWGNFQLSNTNDEIILEHSGIEINRVEYNESPWPIAVGRSLSLDPGFYDGINNQNETSWCTTPSEVMYALDGGDYGTPGRTNPSCAGGPAIVSVVPDYGIDAGGETVTLIGSMFTGITSVQIGSLDCPSFDVLDDTHITCVTPPQASGNYDVVVSNGGEPAILENGFRYTSSVGSRIDWAAIKFPRTLLTSAGGSVLIYGQVFEPGITGTGSPPPAILAQVGFGPQGSDPTTTPGWSWFSAEYNPHCSDCGPENDEFIGSLVFPSAGTFSFAYRFSDDGGYTFLYADFDPGTADGFSISDLGTAIID